MKHFYLFICLFFTIQFHSQNVFPSIGNVGIGTASPSFALHLYSNPFLAPRDLKVEGGSVIIGNITHPTSYFFENSKLLLDAPLYIEGEHAGLRIKSNSIGSKWVDLGVADCNGCFSNNSIIGDIVLRGYSSGSFIITNEATGNLKFATKESVQNQAEVRMIIDKDGKVGIGTETPDSELAVNGLIHAKEVKVDLAGWPDYVFFDSYELPTIQQVENFIKENGHLRGMPSAKQIESEGLDLGMMNKLLMQKIEELTLYIIDLNKEIIEIKKSIKENNSFNK